MSQSTATIKIKNLRLRAYIGFNEEERTKLQDIVINAIIKYDAKDAIYTDEVNDAVNYKTITKQIINHVSESNFLLLEKLVNDVLQIIKDAHEDIFSASVEVDKPHALRFSDSVSLSLSFDR